MAMRRYEPYSALRPFSRYLDRLMGETMEVMPMAEEAEAWVPPVDIYETDSDIIVTLPLPGVRPESVDINVTGQSLTIRAECPEMRETGNVEFYRRECPFGKFELHATLPTDVKAQDAEARLEYGVLTLRLPKTEEAIPKRIEVKGARRTEEAEPAPEPGPEKFAMDVTMPPFESSQEQPAQ